MKIKKVLGIHLFWVPFIIYIYCLRSQALSNATVITGFQILLICPSHPKLEDTVLGLDQCIVVGLWHSKDDACCSAWSNII